MLKTFLRPVKFLLPMIRGKRHLFIFAEVCNVTFSTALKLCNIPFSTALKL